MMTVTIIQRRSIHSLSGVNANHLIRIQKLYMKRLQFGESRHKRCQGSLTLVYRTIDILASGQLPRAQDRAGKLKLVTRWLP